LLLEMVPLRGRHTGGVLVVSSGKFLRNFENHKHLKRIQGVEP